MARKRLGSRILKNAQRRLTNLKAISPELDLGDPLTVPKFEKLIDNFDKKLEQYNGLLAILDALRVELKEDEATLGDFAEQMLMGVACKFGKSSYEYTKAGGIRKRDRKRPTRILPPGTPIGEAPA